MIENLDYNHLKVKVLKKDYQKKKNKNNIMKYLGIFQVIWFILVVLFTLFELIIVIMFNLIRFLWNFKWPKTWWSDFNSAENPWDNSWGGYEYEDKTPFETIKRRFINTF